MNTSKNIWSLFDSDLYLRIKNQLKYRYLTYQELELFGEDFSDFLYTKGLSLFEWRLLQDQYSEHALRILGKYSDLTFDKVMKSVDFLEKRSSKSLESVFCADSGMTILGIQIPIHSSIDLLNIHSTQHFSNYELGTCKSYQKKVPYCFNRENDIFNLIEAGYTVVNDQVFNFIHDLRQAQMN